jgi:excisionase family DNA binding protein
VTELSDLLATIEDAIERVVDARVRELLAELPVTPPSPWLTVSEAADYLRTSERTVQRLVTRHRVCSATIGRRRLLHRDDLDALAAREEKREPLRPRRQGVE